MRHINIICLFHQHHTPPLDLVAWIERKKSAVYNKCTFELESERLEEFE